MTGEMGVELASNRFGVETVDKEDRVGSDIKNLENQEGTGMVAC